jgi:hypothetical protein
MKPEINIKARKTAGTPYCVTPSAGDPFRISVAGDFPGHHARYVLRSAVSGISERGQA